MCEKQKLLKNIIKKYKSRPKFGKKFKGKNTSNSTTGLNVLA